MNNSATIENRLPVWEALSEFFLDSELDETDYQRIAKVLASSRYSIQETEDILRFEVYPELIWNLRSMAGVWGGFDSNCLREALEPRLNRRPKIKWPKLQWGLVRDHWNYVSEMVETKRANLANKALVSNDSAS